MKPLVSVGALGGTIAMTTTETGAVTPALDAEDLLAPVPGLDALAEVTSRSLANLPSPSILPSHILAALDYAKEMVDGGAAGVVLTHGTDTLEETAYFLDLLWDREEPIVLTGAMRGANLPGADGPANLLAAIATAIDPAVRGMGTLVVLDDTIHLARLVSKTHSTAVSAFQSPGWGPIGRIVEGRVRLMYKPATTFPALPVPGPHEIQIPVIQSPLGDEGRWAYGLALTNPHALVIEASGVGHLSMRTADACEQLVTDGLLVAMVTRTGSGSTTEHSYAYPGSEEDLIARGIIPGGFLTGRKLRILLHILTSAGMDREEIISEVHRRGQ
ncbi:asparaginase [Flaviflexus massiliensis]|uniref:asparaginase n=1 Tax=Flaviflexus massiliensis TaxID=1522309 RepID=UPI0006D5609C|nr:asparaginase [Flaviflexus massiliensis]